MEKTDRIRNLKFVTGIMDTLAAAKMLIGIASLLFSLYILNSAIAPDQFSVIMQEAFGSDAAGLTMQMLKTLAWIGAVIQIAETVLLCIASYSGIRFLRKAKTMRLGSEEWLSLAKKDAKVKIACNAAAAAILFISVDRSGNVAGDFLVLLFFAAVIVMEVLVERDIEACVKFR